MKICFCKSNQNLISRDISRKERTKAFDTKLDGGADFIDGECSHVNLPSPSNLHVTSTYALSFQHSSSNQQSLKYCLFSCEEAFLEVQSQVCLSDCL